MSKLKFYYTYKLMDLAEKIIDNPTDNLLEEYYYECSSITGDYKNSSKNRLNKYAFKNHKEPILICYSVNDPEHYKNLDDKLINRFFEPVSNPYDIFYSSKNRNNMFYNSAIKDELLNNKILFYKGFDNSYMDICKTILILINSPLIQDEYDFKMYCFIKNFDDFKRVKEGVELMKDDLILIWNLVSKNILVKKKYAGSTSVFFLIVNSYQQDYLTFN